MSTKADIRADGTDGFAGGLHPSKRRLLVINVIGGCAVLASYAHGIAANPLTRGDVWGGVPEFLQPLYTLNMLFAAAGYFAFSHYVFFRLDPERVRVLRRLDFGAFEWLYALILLPSAAWMPLTFAMLDAPSMPLWWAIRIDLALVGLGSLGLLAAILSAEGEGADRGRRLAALGCAAFCLQTAVLDALVWPAYFPL
jgi:hypothetical protein